MGKFSITSETAFAYPAEAIFDFVTDPSNWVKPYKSSSSSGTPSKQARNLTLPLEFGDEWTERVELPPNTHLSTWRLITVDRPRKFVFQQHNDIGRKEDGTGVSGGLSLLVTRSSRMWDRA
jgi:hypothetical protein